MGESIRLPGSKIGASRQLASRNLVALNQVVEKAIQEHRGEAESLEWVEGGANASNALGLSAADVDELCEALKLRFRGGI